jgi:TonB-linked SusC/RagA family outer membrane protein
LKDASAAIYGARAANGVVLVTTKRGKKGKPKVRISSSYGVQDFTKIPEMHSADEWMDLVNLLKIYNLPANEWSAARAASGQAFTRPNGDLVQPVYSSDLIQNTASGTDPWLYPSSNFAEEVFASAPIIDQNIQISGGDENTSYIASLSNLSQELNFKNAPDGYDKLDLRLNLDTKINDYLKMDVGLYTRNENLNKMARPYGDTFFQTYSLRPTNVAYWPSGEPGPGDRGWNPVVNVTDQNGFDETKTNIIQSNIGLTFDVPGIEGLSLRGLVSYDKMNVDRKKFVTPYILYSWDGINRDSSGLTPVENGLDSPELTQDNISLLDISATFNLTYEKDFGDHYFKFLGGITREEGVQDFTRVIKSGFLSKDLPHLSFGTDVKSTIGTGYETARLNYFGRLNYNLKNKYLLELVFRYDGSYLFPEQGRYGFFPGVSAGWVISDESFWNSNFLSFFKMRASIGQLGSDSVNPFQFLSSYGFSQTALTDVYTTAYETKVPNPNITWETQTSRNIGFDLLAMDSNLSLSLDIFKNTREDILTLPNVTLPSYTGITPPNQNIGEFENTGYELNLGYNGETSKGLSYSFSFNLSDSNSKIVFIDEPELADRPWQRETGGDVSRLLLYESNGIFRSQAEVDANTLDYSALTAQLKPGDVRIVDTNGDGKITNADRTRIGGSPFFDTQFGLNTTLKYKNFDFNMYWNGATGGYQNIEWENMSSDSWNIQRYISKRAWSLDNTNAEYPRLANNASAWYSMKTDVHMMKRDFIRLKNLEIGYNLDEKICNMIKAESFRLSLSGTNLITITDYPYDPEVAQSLVDAQQTKADIDDRLNNFASGWAYPSLQRITFGVQVTF